MVRTAARSAKWDNAHQCNGPTLIAPMTASRSRKWDIVRRCNGPTFTAPMTASRNRPAVNSSNAGRCSTDNIAARNRKWTVVHRCKIVAITRNRQPRRVASTVSRAVHRLHPHLRKGRSKASGE